MNNQLLSDFFLRNRWLVERFIDTAAMLSPEVLTGERSGSRGTIEETLVHVVAAMDVWRRRLDGESPTSMLGLDDLPDLEACRHRFSEVTDSYLDLVSRLSPGELGEKIDYRNTRGDEFSMNRDHILLHVLTHTSDHLAQVSVFLTQSGASPGEMDFMLYVMSGR